MCRDSFRGATWVSIHNGGGTGWGESINGGFGLVSLAHQVLLGACPHNTYAAAVYSVSVEGSLCYVYLMRAGATGVLHRVLLALLLADVSYIVHSHTLQRTRTHAHGSDSLRLIKGCHIQRNPFLPRVVSF